MMPLPKVPSLVSDKAGSLGLWVSRFLAGFVLPLFSWIRTSEFLCSKCDDVPVGVSEGCCGRREKGRADPSVSHARGTEITWGACQTARAESAGLVQGSGDYIPKRCPADAQAAALSATL